MKSTQQLPRTDCSAGRLRFDSGAVNNIAFVINGLDLDLLLRDGHVEEAVLCVHIRPVVCGLPGQRALLRGDAAASACDEAGEAPEHSPVTLCVCLPELLVVAVPRHQKV